jgi:hypothetical protein
MDGGLAPLEGDDSPPVNHRQAADWPGLATPRWTAVDLQTLRRVRSSRTIMTSRRAYQKSGWSLDELLREYLELKELRAKVAEAETRALRRVVTPARNNDGDELV